MPRTRRSPFATLHVRRRLSAVSLLIAASLCVAVMLLAPGARAAVTWHVSPGSKGACTLADPNCATIQAAVNAAITSSNIIQVAAGTYAEHVIIGKNITINGAGAAQTIVDGTQSGTVFTINLGTVNLSGMTVTNGKITTDFGGGIYVNSGTVSITNSTISNNSTSRGGGGIFNASGTLNLTGSTLSNNFASQGGGIHNGGGTVNITSSTLSNNSAISSGGGINNSNNGTVSLRSSIVAGNTSTSSTTDPSGSFTSQGHDLVGASDGTNGFANGVNGDIVGTTAAPIDAKLSPLGFYGGPTQTQLPLCGSPAIDAGDDAVTVAPLILTTDQRGAQGGRSR